MPTENAVLDHVGLSVADMDAASRWYQDTLRLTVDAAYEIPNVGVSIVMLLHPTGFRLELVHRADSVPGIEPVDPNAAARTRGYGHICLRVDDVVATLDHLVAAGATLRVPPRSSFRNPGRTVGFVSDPEGNLIEVLDRKAEHAHAD